MNSARFGERVTVSVRVSVCPLSTGRTAARAAVTGVSAHVVREAHARVVSVFLPPTRRDDTVSM